MTNDAKYGMLAGVLGVIVAGAVLSQKPQLPPDPPNPQAARTKTAQPQPPTTEKAGAPALPSTPVPRTRSDVSAQSTSHKPDQREP